MSRSIFPLLPNGRRVQAELDQHCIDHRQIGGEDLHAMQYSDAAECGPRTKARNSGSASISLCGRSQLLGGLRRAHGLIGLQRPFTGCLQIHYRLWVVTAQLDPRDLQHVGWRCPWRVQILVR